MEYLKKMIIQLIVNRKKQIITMKKRKIIILNINFLKAIKIQMTMVGMIFEYKFIVKNINIK